MVHARLLVASLVAMFAAPAAFAGKGSIANPSGDTKFQVNFRYVPNAQQLADSKQALTRMSTMLCDATEGQVKLKEIRLTGGATDEDQAGFWFYGTDFRSNGSSYLNGRSLGTPGHRMSLSNRASFRADVLAHEFGHHAFGLGEQYDEQDRTRACGIGPGFDATDERNHSIMQQTGSVRCVGGASAGQRCLRDSDCAGAGTCQAVLMSELSVKQNHDPLQGNVGCKPGGKTTSVRVSGLLPAGGAIQTFDRRSFITARNTSRTRTQTTIYDSNGKRLAEPVYLYFTRSGVDEYMVTAAIDGKVTGGTAGSFVQIEQWTVDFKADRSVDRVSEEPTRFDLAGIPGSTTLTIELDLKNLRLSSVGPFISTAGDGSEVCAWKECKTQKLWNTNTNRWETSDQTMAHGGSDWDALVKNYTFLTAPAGRPVEAAPAVCNTPPTFVEDIVGSDQVLLVMDRSGSMAWSSRKGVVEVCGNRVDDDRDGQIDEKPCAESRLSFAQAAARAFVDLQQRRGIQLGLMRFNDGNKLVRRVANLTTGNAAAYRTDINALVASGTTAIGSALDASRTEFARVKTAGRSRTALLLTDGYSNAGSDPAKAAAALKKMNVRVFSIPAGRQADNALLGRISKETGGDVLAAPDIAELPAIYAELAARHRGEALALPRTRFAVAQFPDQAREEGEPAEPIVPETSFDVPVEPGADALMVFIAGRNAEMVTWSVGFELHGPNGELFDHNSPEVTADPYYLFVRVPHPAAGMWTLRALPTGGGLQEGTALAHVEHPAPDFVAAALPRLASVAAPVRITATPGYEIELDGELYIDGVVRRPDGSEVPITLSRLAPNRPWRTDFSDYIGQGTYEVRLHLDAYAPMTAAGESIFEGDERLNIVVPAFERYTTTSFYVTDGGLPECPGCDEEPPAEPPCEEACDAPLELEVIDEDPICEEPFILEEGALLFEDELR